MSTLTYSKAAVTFLTGAYGLGNGSSGDFNQDGYADIAFSTDISSASNSYLSSVGTYIYDVQANDFEPFPLTIDGVAGIYPQVYFGMYTVVRDINGDGISDIIPIDQSERRPAGIDSGPIFVGAPQYAYLSIGVGIYEKKSMATGNLCVHGWGAIESTDGLFRFVLNTPWLDQTESGLSTVISAYDKVTNEFEATYLTRDSSYHIIDGENYQDYFYQSAVDVNNDGNTDIVAFSTSLGRNAIYLNDGHGGFSFQKSFSTGLIPHIDVEEITFGDFNGDQYQDFVVLGVNRVDWATSPTYYKTLRVLINDKGSGFVDETSIWLGDKFQNVDSSMGYLDTYDINQDGKSDISFNHLASETYYDSVNNTYIDVPWLFDVFVSNGTSFDNFTITNDIDVRSIPLSNNSVTDGKSIFSLKFEGDFNLVTNKNVPTKMFGNIDDFTRDLTADGTYIFKSAANEIWIDDSKTRFTFDDQTIALDISGTAGQAYRIYRAAFDRDPIINDTAGLGYWIAQMDAGMSMTEVAARFIDSTEFRLLYGTTPTNGEFLTKVYNNVLDRDPDSDGYVWWMDQLANNPEKTWQKVLADFSESSENQANVASLIGNGITYDAWTG